ncbi:MAG: SEC-C domain-containing protein [Holophagales bacterium]|nr:SEC-C domain-containing protein [Holophagales bacterium]
MIERQRKIFEQVQRQRAAAEALKPQTVQRSVPKVGRNEPCPCGSGKKYKKCHGARRTA